MTDAEARCLARPWFYPYVLPSGQRVPSTHGGELDATHYTRTQMLRDAVTGHFGASPPTDRRAIDLACHQGWFSLQAAALGFGEVLGVDARAEHVADAQLIAEATGATGVRFARSDVFALDADALGGFDLVLCLGLLYHLEHPAGALRHARHLCRGLCVIETQVAPGLSGWLDYGSYRFVRPMKGSFAIIDETDDTHGPEASTLGICLVPSHEALLWILAKVGFARAEVLPVPADGYEQLLHHKRVMVAAWV